MRAVLDRVVLKRKEKPEKEGAIYLPDQHTEIPNEGEVVSVGPNVTLNVKVGDTVIFKWCEGSWVQEGDDWLFSIEERFLLGVKESGHVA